MVCLLVVGVAPMLSPGESLLLLAAFDLLGILLIPPFLILGWRLDNTHEESLVNLFQLVILLEGLLKEEEVLFRALRVRVDELLFLVLRLQLLLSLLVLFHGRGLWIMFVGEGLQEEGCLDLMLKQAPLVESCESVDGSLKQAQLLHVVVDVQVILDLSLTISQDLTELSCLAEDGSDGGFED